MSRERDPLDSNERDDAAFGARVAAAWAPPPMTPARRARFDARLGERIAGDRLRVVPWLAAGAAAFAAGLLVLTHLGRGPADAPVRIAGAPAASTSSVLADAIGSGEEFEDTLPPEYQAIASLLGEL